MHTATGWFHFIHFKCLCAHCCGLHSSPSGITTSMFLFPLQYKLSFQTVSKKKKKQKQFIGNICLQSHYTECNPAEAETKALITWAAFWSCSAESGHTWGLSSFESISSLPWCSMMGNNYWRNVWLNRFISSLCFYFQKIRGSPVTWLEGKEMEILKHTCNSLFLLWWKGASVISYCTTGTYGQNQAGFT